MDWDEPVPVSKAIPVVGEVLDTISVEELRVRIATLRDEITRLEQEIAKKEAHQARADTVFKS